MVIGTNQYFPHAGRRKAIFGLMRAGPGTYQSSEGVGGTTNFAANGPRNVYSICLFGSYYGGLGLVG